MLTDGKQQKVRELDMITREPLSVLDLINCSDDVIWADLKKFTGRFRPTRKEIVSSMCNNSSYERSALRMRESN